MAARTEDPGSTVRPDYATADLVVEVVVQQLRPLEACRVIDIGAGDSYLPDALATRGCEVVAIDKEFASSGPADAGGAIERICLDARDLRAERLGKFDKAVMSLLLQYVDRSQISEIWAGARRVMRSGGTLVTVDLHPASKMGGTIPWRRVRSAPLPSYWSEGPIDAEVYRASGEASRTVYHHHTMTDLLNPGVVAGFRVECVTEFPETWLGKPVDVPAYFAVRWRA